MMNIEEFLINNTDKIYKDYCEKSIFTKYKIYGVKNNKLKKIAKNIVKAGKEKEILDNFDFKSFEEIQLYIYVLNMIDDFEMIVDYLDKLLDIIDNWSNCDSIKPNAFVDNMEKIKKCIERWLNSNYIYKVRFAIICCIRYFYDDYEMLKKIINLKSNEYYINIAKAWYITECLGENFEASFEVLKENIPDKATLSLMNQKVGYSMKISQDNKIRLKELKKIKKNLK